MTDRKLGAGTVTIDGERYATTTFEYEGARLTMRELQQDEIDDAFEASTGPDGKVNGRLLTRMQMAKSLIEPETPIDALGKFPARKFGAVLRHFNDLHSLPVENPTVPAGSAGPTLPDGGSESPTT